MATKTEIANMALSFLGVGFTIQNLDTDKSEEANSCRIFYETAKDKVMRAVSWPFASTVVQLQLVASDPTTEWDYSYRYPSDCEYFRRILSDYRSDSQWTKIPYRIVKDTSGTGKLIYTDREAAYGEYTLKDVSEGEYAPEFVFSLAYLLASLIAGQITQGDRQGLRNEMMQMYMLTMSEAASNAKNEEHKGVQAESEFIEARI